MRENNSEELASTSASSDTSVENFPAPLPFVKSHIAYHVDGDIIPTVDSQSILANATHFDIRDSTEVFIGNKTIIQGDVTVYHGPLSEHQNTEGQINENKSKTECNGNVRVVPPPSPSPTIHKPTGILKRHFKSLMILLTIVTLVGAVTLITLSLAKPQRPSYIPSTTSEQTTTSTTQTPHKPPLNHYIFNRSQWGARDPAEPLHPMVEPVQLVIIKHTKTTPCKDVSSCFTAMQDLQNADVGVRHFCDVRYNFVIGGEGNIYEGRGWGMRNPQLNNTIDVAFMGDYEKEVPSQQVVVAGKLLIVKGLLNGHLDYNAIKVVGHNQTEDTESPGANLYKEIVQWEWYSDEIIKGEGEATKDLN